MLIWTCNAMKTNHKDQLHVQHTPNAKYMKYMHLGYKILQGYKCEVLKIYNQHLKVLKKMLQSIEINTSTKYKTEI